MDRTSWTQWSWTDLQVWIKQPGELPFLYGNHVVKAHLGRITEDTPEHQGVVVYNMADMPLVSNSTISRRLLPPDPSSPSSLLSSHCTPRPRHPLRAEVVTDPQGFGVTARSTLDTRKLDPTGIIVFHQADVGEFLRDEDTMF